MFDVVIKNGTVIDGTGVPGIKADIGILNGKIAKIGNILENADTTIDATGLVVSPGFIDSHSHADHKVFYFPEQREKLEQGITTSVAGQCGGSAAPVKKDSQSDNVTEFGDPDEIRQTMSGFISTLSSHNLGANLVPFVGHGTIRKAVMGLSGAAADAEQVKQMEELLAECFEAGACGLSFGLFYAPGCYASTDEATALAKIAAKYNRPVSAHIRSESNLLVEAVEEFISIIKNSGARGILSHHKAVRKHNWGKVHKTIELLKNAVADGVDIYCDLYPYCASSTGLSQAFVPFTWRADGKQKLMERIADPVLYKQNKEDFIKASGNFLDWVLVNSCPGFPEYEGMTINQIAKIHGKDDFDTAMDIVVSGNDRASACFFTVSEEDLMHVLSWDRTMICTDAGMISATKRNHPRLIGSFPRAISRYVREKNVVDLPEMIRRMTSLPAYVYGLDNKGKIAEGYDADLCIINPDTFDNPSDFINCRQPTVGLNYVLIDGKVVVQDGVFNGTRAANLISK